MANFAIVEDTKVTNIILADSKAIAEEVTGKTCVEFTVDNPAHIGLGYDGTTFEQPALVEQPTE
jgi:hypothetical protein